MPGWQVQLLLAIIESTQECKRLVRRNNQEHTLSFMFLVLHWHPQLYESHIWLVWMKMASPAKLGSLGCLIWPADSLPAWLVLCRKKYFPLLFPKGLQLKKYRKDKCEKTRFLHLDGMQPEENCAINYHITFFLSSNPSKHQKMESEDNKLIIKRSNTATFSSWIVCNIIPGWPKKHMLYFKLVFYIHL